MSELLPGQPRPLHEDEQAMVDALADTRKEIGAHQVFADKARKGIAQHKPGSDAHFDAHTEAARHEGPVESLNREANVTAARMRLDATQPRPLEPHEQEIVDSAQPLIEPLRRAAGSAEFYGNIVAKDGIDVESQHRTIGPEGRGRNPFKKRFWRPLSAAQREEQAREILASVRDAQVERRDTLKEQAAQVRDAINPPVEGPGADKPEN